MDLFPLLDEYGYKGMEIFLSRPDARPLNIQTPESIRQGHALKLTSYSIAYVNEVLRSTGESQQINCDEFNVEALKLVMDIYVERDVITYVSDGINLASVLDDPYVEKYEEVLPIVRLNKCYKMNDNLIKKFDVRQ